jgi:Ca2+-binding EF-hand superfamily protein
MAHELTFEEIQDCKRIFEDYKMTNESIEDSKMRLSDLEKALNMLEFKISNSELDDICVSMNLDSEIDFMTFLRVAAVKYKQKEFSTYMYDAFKFFDKNSKGFLDYEELRAIITDHGAKLHLDSAEEFLKDLGYEKNSPMKYEDFVEKNS